MPCAVFISNSEGRGDQGAAINLRLPLLARLRLLLDGQSLWRTSKGPCAPRQRTGCPRRWFLWIGSRQTVELCLSTRALPCSATFPGTSSLQAAIRRPEAVICVYFPHRSRPSAEDGGPQNEATNRQEKSLLAKRVWRDLGLLARREGWKPRPVTYPYPPTCAIRLPHTRHPYPPTNRVAAFAGEVLRRVKLLERMWLFRTYPKVDC